VLFGVSPALSQKFGLDRTPIVGSALLYGGAGLALAAVLAVERMRGVVGREAPIRRADAPSIVVAIFAGGLCAPLLLLFGLARTGAGVASLLLTLETPFTAALALVFLREHLGRRGAMATALIVLGAACLAGSPFGARTGSSVVGVTCVAAACLAWAIDNTVTQRLSSRDPRAVVSLKGCGAAICALALAFVTHAPWPTLRTSLLALVLGAASYGASLVLYVSAQREIGAARTGALFAVAPFVGSLVAIPIVGEHLHANLALSGALMALGVVLFARERHDHEHTHEPLEHDHVHTHDDGHHEHSHTGDEGPEPHAHPHRHAPTTHRHAHASDVHHRHRH
jgi:drug/metabolite transporter (DMT)-like permease